MLHKVRLLVKPRCKRTFASSHMIFFLSYSSHFLVLDSHTIWSIATSGVLYLRGFVSIRSAPAIPPQICPTAEKA